MNKKDIILIISTSVFAITTAYFGLQYVRYKNHNAYHRSRMFELEMLSQISMVLPVGSTLDEFLYEFGLNKSAYHALNDRQGLSQLNQVSKSLLMNKGITPVSASISKTIS